MSTAPPTETEENQKTGCYVYGILPGDVELAEEIRGVGDREVTLVGTDALAALVSEVDLTIAVGTPEDLQAHQALLDAVAADVPVLPLRFGAVLSSVDAVREELLEAHADEFITALEQLEDKAQFVVKGQYEEQAILTEILSDDPEAEQLREQIRGQDADATREERMRLGEIIGQAVEARRDEDTQLLLSRVGDHTAASVRRDPTHELDAVNVAFLVARDEEEAFEGALEDLGADWSGRVDLRVLGPMAAYDFVRATFGSGEAQG